MNLGEALYRTITNGRSPHTEVATFGGAVEYFLLRAGGVASIAARLAGIPDSTFRGWMRGRQSNADRAGGMIGAAVRAQRRERLTKAREKRLRQPGSLDGLTVSARLNYKSRKGSAEPEREIGLGAYMRDIANDLIDAYLDGAPTDELAAILHEGIGDAPFYEATFDPEGDMGWDITDLDGWA